MSDTTTAVEDTVLVLWEMAHLFFRFARKKLQGHVVIRGSPSADRRWTDDMLQKRRKARTGSLVLLRMMSVWIIVITHIDR